MAYTWDSASRSLNAGVLKRVEQKGENGRVIGRHGQGGSSVLDKQIAPQLVNC